VPRALLDRLKRAKAVFVDPAEDVLRRSVALPEPAADVGKQRSLNVAIVGLPNAGKSTLLNRVLGVKVSAVSPKYNTTRDRVLGVLTVPEKRTQIVFWDTPGFVPEAGLPGFRYDASLVTTAAETIPAADAVLFVLDAARRLDKGTEATLRRIAHLCAEDGAHLFVVANKMDLLCGENLTKARGLLWEKRRRARAQAAAQAEAKAAGAASSHDGDEADEEPSAAELAAAIAATVEGGGATTAESLGAAEAAAEAGVGADDRVAVAPSSAPPRAPSAASQHRQRRDMEAEVQRYKLDMIADALEAACFEAGIVGPGGLDDPLLSQEGVETGSSAATASGVPLGAVYRFFPAVIPVSALTDTRPAAVPVGRDGDVDMALRNKAGAGNGAVTAGGYSAFDRQGAGLLRLRSALLRLALPRPWTYSAHLVTDLSPAERVREVVREKLFWHLHKEVPYKIGHETRSWRELPGEVPGSPGPVVIDHDLRVPTGRVAAMLLARRAGPLRAITKASIADLEEALGRKVHLYLHIKVLD
jgi:small GTP-binding protein